MCDNVAAFKSNGHEAQIKKFLDFVYQDKYQLQFDREYDLLPATVSAANALAKDPVFGSFLKALPHSVQYPIEHRLGAGEDQDPEHDRDRRHRHPDHGARQLCSRHTRQRRSWAADGAAWARPPPRSRSRAALSAGDDLDARGAPPPGAAALARSRGRPDRASSCCGRWWCWSQSSFQHIAADGFVVGGNGTRNYSNLWHEPALRRRPAAHRALGGGRRRRHRADLTGAGAAASTSGSPSAGWRARALIIPWAASVMMTALIFRWALDPNVGVINVDPARTSAWCKQDRLQPGGLARQPDWRAGVDDGRGDLRLAAVHHLRAPVRAAERSPRSVRGRRDRRRRPLVRLPAR